MGLAKKSKSEIDAKTVEGYDKIFDANDKTGMVKEIEKKTKFCLDEDKEWREAAREDFRFALGDQWTDEERNKLKDQERPCLTFNKIEPLVDLVGGWERENSPRIRIYPEGGEDKLFSEIGDKCVKFVDKTTKLNYKLDHEFDDGLVCGRGWLELAISYDNDLINGELKFRNNVVYDVLSDPDGIEYDLSDTEYMIKLSWRTKERLKKQFPDMKARIDKLKGDVTEYLDLGEPAKEGDADNYHNGKDKMSYSEQKVPGEETQPDKYLLKEYYHRKYVEKYCVYNVNTGQVEKYNDEEMATARIKEILAEYDQRYEQSVQEWQALRQTAQVVQMSSGEPGALPEKPVKYDYTKSIKVIKKPVPEMWYAATAAGFLMQKDTRSPLAPHYEGFPFFPFKAKYYISAEDPVLSNKGITRNIKDPQREVNKSRSSFLHILSTLANSGWIGDRDALKPEEWKDLMNLGSVPGIVIKKKKGSELQRIEPAGVSMANIMRGDKAEDDIKTISGINSDAMAIQDKTTSGKAIGLRIRQALTILAKYFRNFRYTKEMVGTAIYAMIPAVMDVRKLRKILGEDFIQKNGIDDGYLMAFLQQIADGKYNIQITESDTSSTIRQETFENLMEMAGAGMPIPPDVILEFSSMANSKEIIDRVKEYAQQAAQAQDQK